MRNLFQNLDLYKAIILASLVLLPVVGFWAYHLDGQLEEARKAIVNATRRGGDLEEIGKFQKAVEEQKRNEAKRAGQESYSIYFNKWIVQSAPRLKRSHFAIAAPRERRVRNKAIDSMVAITFKEGTKQLPLSRDELLAILFNAESQSPQWKLRDLKIRNVSQRSAGRNRAPIPPLEDEWEVQEMVFVSRRPLRE